MWDRAVKWVVDAILKALGFQKIPEKQREKINWAKDAEEMLRKEQEDEWRKEREEWENATIEEKQHKILSRFPDRDND